MTNETGLQKAEDTRLSFGQTQLRPQDFVPPRVKVVQPLSQEVQQDVKPGSLYNTLTGEDYGTTLLIQPILPFMQRILLVRGDRRSRIEDVLGRTLPEGDGLMCRSFDMIQGKGFPGIECDTCPLSQWDEETRKPPLCTETYNVAGMNEIGELVIISFQKSSAKIGKRLFSAIRMKSAASPPWTSVYEIATRQEKNDLGTFFVPDFRVVKEPPSTEQVTMALRWAEQLRGVVIDVTPEDDDATSESREPEQAPF